MFEDIKIWLNTPSGLTHGGTLKWIAISYLAGVIAAYTTVYN